MRALLDTNVLISAAIFPYSIPRRVLDHFLMPVLDARDSPNIG